ncbi:MAG: hypothetical protein GF364_03510 [Candidatus Lokiarchaeota archaeon]|nr:hypothetical protein [Candidatus Lokiarchaeota archaeon]
MFLEFANGISTEEFATIISKNALLCCYVHADWCVLCQKTFSPMKRISEEFSNISFISVNLTKSRWMNEKLGIHHIPLILIIKDKILIRKIKIEKDLVVLREYLNSLIE